MRGLLNRFRGAIGLPKGNVDKMSVGLVGGARTDVCGNASCNNPPSTPRTMSSSSASDGSFLGNGDDINTKWLKRNFDVSMRLRRASSLFGRQRTWSRPHGMRYVDLDSLPTPSHAGRDGGVSPDEEEGDRKLAAIHTHMDTHTDTHTPTHADTSAPAHTTDAGTHTLTRTRGLSRLRKQPLAPPPFPLSLCSCIHCHTAQRMKKRSVFGINAHAHAHTHAPRGDGLLGCADAHGHTLWYYRPRHRSSRDTPPLPTRDVWIRDVRMEDFDWGMWEAVWDYDGAEYLEQEEDDELFMGDLIICDFSRGRSYVNYRALEPHSGNTNTHTTTGTRTQAIELASGGTHTCAERGGVVKGGRKERGREEGACGGAEAGGGGDDIDDGDDAGAAAAAPQSMTTPLRSKRTPTSSPSSPPSSPPASPFMTWCHQILTRTRAAVPRT